MRVIIRQENDDVALQIHALMKTHNTNLSRICRDHDMDYTQTYRLIHHENIEIEFMQKIVEKIDPDSTVRSTFTVSLGNEERGNFYEQTTQVHNQKIHF